VSEALIAEAMDKVGKEGVITVEESQTFGLELELTEGNYAFVADERRVMAASIESI
jgi:hypothetical protein